MNATRLSIAMCKAFGPFKFFIEGRVMRLRGQEALVGLCSHYRAKPSITMDPWIFRKAPGSTLVWDNVPTV